MDPKRILRHLLTTPATLRRAFPPSALAAIERAIQASEGRHGGQIRFAVEASLDSAPLWRGQSPRDRAVDLFAQLRVWDTEHNSGVLLYVLLADRAVEIVADRGIHARCGSPFWTRICRAMEARFRAGEFEAGALEGIAAVTQELVHHFPGEPGHANELPDRPLLL